CARTPAKGRGAATQSGRLDDGHRSAALGGAVHRRCRGALAPSRVAAALCRALRPTITQTPGPARNTLRPVGDARQPACRYRRRGRATLVDRTAPGPRPAVSRIAEPPAA